MTVKLFFFTIASFILAFLSQLIVFLIAIGGAFEIKVATKSSSLNFDKRVTSIHV